MEFPALVPSITYVLFKCDYMFFVLKSRIKIDIATSPRLPKEIEQELLSLRALPKKDSKLIRLFRTKVIWVKGIDF